MQSAIAQTTVAEWRKLPPLEIECIDRTLRSRGASVETFIRQGIVPTIPPVPELRRECRAQYVAPNPRRELAQTQDRGGGSISPQYKVQGLAVGDRAEIRGGRFADFRCNESKIFSGFLFCSKSQRLNGASRSSTMLVGASDGVASYLSMSVKPAHLDRVSVEKEIERLAELYGARPRLMHQSSNGRNAVIAIWGEIQLSPLNQSDISLIANDVQQTRGLLVDFFGDIKDSARQGLPIFVIGGRLGYLWSGSYDNTGIGSLRFMTSDASIYAQSNPNSPRARSIEQAKQAPPAFPAPQPSPIIASPSLEGDARRAESDASIHSPSNPNSPRARSAEQATQAPPATPAPQPSSPPINVSPSLEDEARRAEIEKNRATAAAAKAVEDEAVRKKLAEEEQARKAWLIATDRVREPRYSELAKSCASGSYGAKRLADAATLKDRAEIRIQLASDCKCLVADMARSEKTQNDLSDFYSGVFSGNLSEAGKKVVAGSLEDCTKYVPSETITEWRKEK